MTTDGRTRWLALSVLCLGDLMIVLDVTIVGVALPSIREDLGFSEESLAWVVNGWLLRGSPATAHEGGGEGPEVAPSRAH